MKFKNYILIFDELTFCCLVDELNGFFPIIYLIYYTFLEIAFE